MKGNKKINYTDEQRELARFDRQPGNRVSADDQPRDYYSNEES